MLTKCFDSFSEELSRGLSGKGYLNYLSGEFDTFRQYYYGGGKI